MYIRIVTAAAMLLLAATPSSLLAKKQPEGPEPTGGGTSDPAPQVKTIVQKQTTVYLNQLLLPAKFDPFDVTLGTLNSVVLDLKFARKGNASVDYTGVGLTDITEYSPPLSLNRSGIAISTLSKLFEPISFTLNKFSPGVATRSLDLTRSASYTLAPIFYSTGFLGTAPIFFNVNSGPEFQVDTRSLLPAKFSSFFSDRYDLSLVYTYKAAAVPSNPGSPVPEPVTWAMMSLGFAFIGGTMRSRNLGKRGRPSREALEDGTPCHG